MDEKRENIKESLKESFKRRKTPLFAGERKKSLAQSCQLFLEKNTSKQHNFLFFAIE